MAAISPMFDSDFDKLTNEIFSILENKFLLDYNQQPPKIPITPTKPTSAVAAGTAGKVRVLSIDGGGSTGGLLAAKSLAHLESSLRCNSGDPNARIADYFDVVSGSGAGGLLAALLFTRGKDGNPILTADQALNFVKNLKSSPRGKLRRLFSPARNEKVFKRVFGEATLKDTLKAVLIPCYDLATSAQLLFSRADALEMDGYDFKMRDVCLATLADRAVEMRSVDRRTRVVAVGGGVAMNNPTAAAITHVMNNKQEFPMCNGVEDIFVLSLGNGESDVGGGRGNLRSPAGFVKIAGDGASDMVDQAVSMAFGASRLNYVRIQVNNVMGKRNGRSSEMLSIAEEMLGEKNVESIMFEGKRVSEKTNGEKLEKFGQEMVKEDQFRKTSSILPTVSLKQTSPSPRSSSATTLSTNSSSSSPSPYL